MQRPDARPDASEQRLADALRARGGLLSGLPAANEPYRSPATPVATPLVTLRRQVALALVVALLVGVVLGAALAGLSVLVPGLLPPFG